jgi:hypothetical protein
MYISASLLLGMSGMGGVPVALRRRDDRHTH